MEKTVKGKADMVPPLLALIDANAFRDGAYILPLSCSYPTLLSVYPTFVCTCVLRTFEA